MTGGMIVPPDGACHAQRLRFLDFRKEIVDELLFGFDDGFFLAADADGYCSFFYFPLA